MRSSSNVNRRSRSSTSRASGDSSTTVQAFSPRSASFHSVTSPGYSACAFAAKAHAENPGLVTLWKEALRGLKACTVVLESPEALDVEDLERRLTLLDERIHAGLLLHASEDVLLRLRREMDSALAAYRR